MEKHRYLSMTLLRYSIARLFSYIWAYPEI